VAIIPDERHLKYQFAVIGGGFFGCAVTLHLRKRGFDQIALIERESELLTRASYRNQARVHNGYHYPRSYVTAYRSRINLPRFCRDYGFAVKTDFVMLYAIASRRSKVIPRQFEHFMRAISANFEAAGSGYYSLFDSSRVAAVYVVEEYAFDARRLREHFHKELEAAGADVILSTECVHVGPCNADRLKIELKSAGKASCIEAETVFNCTYSGLNHTVADGSSMTPLKHEVAEIALVDVPSEMRELGVTVMDGPFFSCMPFPAEDCHSLTHVRYTPHGVSIDTDGTRHPMRFALGSQPNSRAKFMIADAARLMPCLRSTRWRRSLFETKTVLLRNETDDGRPVLLRREATHSRLFSVLGAKIDNVYDVLERLDSVLEQSSPMNANSAAVACCGADISEQLPPP
jgi:glycine/D-amino acid oxidase-like deaminating enzyme